MVPTLLLVSLIAATAKSNRADCAVPLPMTIGYGDENRNAGMDGMERMAPTQFSLDVCNSALFSAAEANSGLALIVTAAYTPIHGENHSHTRTVWALSRFSPIVGRQPSYGAAAAGR